MYVRVPLSFGTVGDLLFERGIDKTVRMQVRSSAASTAQGPPQLAHQGSASPWQSLARAVERGSWTASPRRPGSPNQVQADERFPGGWQTSSAIACAIFSPPREDGSIGFA